MAGKVINLEVELSADNLARQLSSLYNKWYIQLSVKQAEWRELRSYLFATDTSKTSNSSSPWKNKTTLPKLTQIRDNLHANYMDALFPNDDWLKWEGYDKSSVTKEKRQAIQTYMSNKLRLSGFRETISRCLYDYIDYGNAFAESVWVNEYYTDPITKEKISTYKGAKALRISPLDHVFNPTAAEYKDSPKFTRYLKNLGELKKDIMNRPELEYDSEAFTKATQARAKLTNFKMEEINKQEGFFFDGFGSISEYYQSGIIEIIEFEGDMYDSVTDTLYENRIITIIDRCYILRNIPNPNWFGKDTKNHVGWRERPDNLYAMGALDNLVGLQYRLDHLENSKADAMDLTINPPLVIKGDVEPFIWSPNAEIHVPEDGDVTILGATSSVFQVNNEIGFLLQLMEEMAGAPKEAMGIRSPGEKTAFEVQQLQTAAGRIFQHKVNKFEIEFLEPLINDMLELAKRNLDITDVVGVIDGDLGVQMFLSITKEDLQAKGKLRPVGARHYAAQALLFQNLVGIFNSPIGQKIGQHVSSIELAHLVEEYMGLEKFALIKENIAIFEQAATQKLVNTAGQMVDSHAATPVEEKLI